jgi:rare lipoprotein A
VKSFLRMLLVAGVFVLSLAAYGGEARAEALVSSWYGPGFEGAVTASGEVYDYGDYTAAHPYLPLGTELLVSYGGESVVVSVNDRGPYVGGVDLDLSQAAAEGIGLTAAGTDVVDVRVLEKRPSWGRTFAGAV